MTNVLDFEVFIKLFIYFQNLLDQLQKKNSFYNYREAHKLDEIRIQSDCRCMYNCRNGKICFECNVYQVQAKKYTESK